MFIVIGCGGREWTDLRACTRALEGLSPDLVLVGGARGADRCWESAARRLGMKVQVVPAQWNRFGASAGYRRNVEMADLAERGQQVWVLATAGGKGTAHMVAESHKRGFTVVTVGKGV